jgi:hypothetical protein
MRTMNNKVTRTKLELKFGSNYVHNAPPPDATTRTYEPHPLPILCTLYIVERNIKHHGASICLVPTSTSRKTWPLKTQMATVELLSEMQVRISHSRIAKHMVGSGLIRSRMDFVELDRCHQSVLPFA